MTRTDGEGGGAAREHPRRSAMPFCKKRQVSIFVRTKMNAQLVELGLKSSRPGEHSTCIVGMDRAPPSPKDQLWSSRTKTESPCSVGNIPGRAHGCTATAYLPGARHARQRQATASFRTGRCAAPRLGFGLSRDSLPVVSVHRGPFRTLPN